MNQVTLSVAGLAACLEQMQYDSAHRRRTRFFQAGDVLVNESLIFDLALAEELVLGLTMSYNNGEGIFRSVRAETHGPHLVYVPGYELQRIAERGMNYLTGVKGPRIKSMIAGSKEHLVFLFFATLTDRRQESGGDFGVYASHCAIFREHPELYTKAVINWSAKRLGKLLSKYKIGVPNQSAKYWIRCAKTLFEDYEGDPVKLYKANGSTVEGVLKFKDRVKKEIIENSTKKKPSPLPGYGPKIASLYSLFMDAFGALPFPVDAFPVDVQVQRLFIQSGVIHRKTKVSNAMMEKVIRPFVCLIAMYHGLSKQDISHAFWLLGSLGCRSCSKRLDAPTRCPIYTKCLGCANTASYFARGLWDPSEAFMQKGAAVVSFGMPEARPTRYSRKINSASPQFLLFPV